MWLEVHLVNGGCTGMRFHDHAGRSEPLWNIAFAEAREKLGIGHALNVEETFIVGTLAMNPGRLRFERHERIEYRRKLSILDVDHAGRRVRRLTRLGHNRRDLFTDVTHPLPRQKRHVLDDHSREGFGQVGGR